MTIYGTVTKDQKKLPFGTTYSKLEMRITFYLHSQQLFYKTHLHIDQM